MGRTALLHSAVTERVPGGSSNVLYGRLADLRNRLLASARFRSWVARIPGLRGIARRQARGVFDLCAGFVYTQVLYSCVRLGLFERLLDGPVGAAELARGSGMALGPMVQLLEGARALGLIEARGEAAYALGARGAVIAGNPAVTAMIEHHALLYRDLSDPLALLRGELDTTELERYWAYARAPQPGALPAAQVAAYSSLMSASQPLIADEVLAAYGFRGKRCLLDVGGGEGAFVAAVAARHPDLEFMLFDLPAVAERARAHLAEAGLDDRVAVHAGDFHCEALPLGADVVSLVRVIHDHDDAEALALLCAVRRCLPPGGTLLLAEPMAGAAGAEPVGAAYFAFYLMAMRSGRPRTAAELGSLLQAADFRGYRVHETALPLQTSLIVAEV